MNTTKPLRIATAIRDYLQTHADIPAAKISALRLSMKADVALNYDLDALPFASAFWERNFWKAVYFFFYEYVKPSMLGNRLLVPGSGVDVTVLGAGSAADTVACLLWLDHELPLQRITLTLIDQSALQLELARNIIDIAKRFLDQAEFDIRYAHLRASEWNPATDSIDMVLMGHFLTENGREKDAMVVKTVAALKPRGDVIIIERQRDPVWQWARQRLALNGVTTHEVGLSEEKFLQIVPALPETEMDITPLYVRGSVPENKTFMGLVRGYFQAWLQQTSDTLPEIFRDDAVYDEKPGIEAPIVGIDSIRRYWDEHPGLQRDVQLIVHNVTYSDTVSVCSFGGEFDTPKQHIAIQGAMVFYLDPYTGKIHRFTEHFGTVKTPLKAGRCL